MAVTTFQPISQFRHFPGEARTVPRVTGIEDDILAKVDDKTSHDIVVLSLLETTQR